MAFKTIYSDITIGTLRFRGVHNLVIRKGLHHYDETATIQVPSIAYILKDGTITKRTTGTIFSEGDRVSISLGYDNDMQEEFRGFVKRIGLDMPLTVECEGYVRQLRTMVDYSLGSAKSTVTTTAKELLLNATEGTEISIMCPVDFPLKNFYVTHANGLQICDWIKEASDRTLTLFFIKPDVLWCGLVYSQYLDGDDVFDLPTVKYRLGWNVVKDNNLKERVVSEPVQVIYNGKLVTGNVIHTASKDKAAQKKEAKLLNNVPDEETMKLFAEEKANGLNYEGYEGKISTFLQPYCQPGYNAFVTDSRYPDRDGTYIIESVETHFGEHGGRRIIQLGPKLG